MRVEYYGNPSHKPQGCKEQANFLWNLCNLCDLARVIRGKGMGIEQIFYGLCDLARVIRGKGIRIEQIFATFADWRDFSWQGDGDRTNLSERGAWRGGFRGRRTVIDAVKGCYSRGARFVRQIQIRKDENRVV